MKIGAAYIRVSTDAQTEYSPDSQLREISSWCEKNKIILPKEYIFIEEDGEKGLSGRSTKKRTVFNKMIGIAKTKPKPFEVLVLWKFSRFARNREDSVVYKTMLRKQLGIDVISVSEPIGDDKLSIIIEAIIEAMDEYYSVNLAEEVKRGMTEKALKGEPLTIAPYGYVFEKNGNERLASKLIPHPKQSLIIKEIFSDYLNGKTMLQIAQQLNTRGVRSNRGNLIENRTIEYILRNPVYIGKIRWNPTGRTRRKYNNQNLIISDGNHEPLIDIATWEAIQAKIETNKIAYRKYSKAQSVGSHWLVGLVRCGNCGAGLVRNGAVYLQCGAYSKGKCGVSHSLHIAPAETAILEQIKKDITTSYKLNVKQLRKQQNDEPDFEKQIAMLEKRLERVKNAYSLGVDTLEEYKDYKTTILSEIADLRLAQQKSTDSTLDSPKIKAAIKSAYEVLSSESVELEIKKTIANQVINKIVFNKIEKSLTITYSLWC